MLQNEICKLGQNLPLATFGSERVMIWHMLNGNQKRFTVEVSPGAYVTDKPSERLHKHENPCKRETSACRVNKIG